MAPPAKRPRLETQQTQSAASKQTSRLTQSELDSELRLQHLAKRLAHNDPLAHASLAFCARVVTVKDVEDVTHRCWCPRSRIKTQEDFLPPAKRSRLAQ